MFNVGPMEKTPWGQRPDGPVLVRDLCLIPGDLLNDGSYRVSFCLSKGHEPVYCHDDALIFDVRDTAQGRDSWYGRWVGAVRPLLEWSTQVLESEAPAAESVVPGSVEQRGNGIS